MTPEALSPNGISEDIKRAVIAALLTGQAAAKVAEETKVSVSTVYRIRKTIGPELERMKQEWREEIQIQLFNTIVETQRTLRDQLEVLRNPQWLIKQSASELAILHGVLHDKQLRLLEALTSAEPQAPDEGLADQGT